MYVKESALVNPAGGVYRIQPAASLTVAPAALTVLTLSSSTFSPSGSESLVSRKLTGIFVPLVGARWTTSRPATGGVLTIWSAESIFVKAEKLMSPLYSMLTLCAPHGNALVVRPILPSTNVTGVP